MLIGEWNNPDTLEVIYQYFDPSILTIEGERSFTNYQEFSNISSEASQDFFARADCPKIFICQLMIVFCFVFILNNLSKLVKKGGVLQ